jgi:hypothetical protein
VCGTHYGYAQASIDVATSMSNFISENEHSQATVETSKEKVVCWFQKKQQRPLLEL